MHIRQVVPDDRPSLRTILDETRVFTDDEVDVALELVDTVLGNPESRDYVIQVAVDQNGRVLGYYCVGPTPLTASTYDLYWIAVLPALQSKGVGSRLLNHAEEFVRSKGATLVVAETSSQPKYEPTRMFYIRNRYAELARIKNYYKAGDDLVVYGKYFSQQHGVN